MAADNDEIPLTLNTNEDHDGDDKPKSSNGRATTLRLNGYKNGTQETDRVESENIPTDRPMINKQTTKSR